MHRARTLAVLLGITMLAGNYGSAWCAANQTRRWRIGVGGSYCNGYWGMLGDHGLPRERLVESRVSDPEYLKQYDVVVMAVPMSNAGIMSRAIAQFVHEGGIAVTENSVWPPGNVLPGKRIGQRKGPNVRFVTSDCPASEGLPEMGLIIKSRQPASAIIPSAGGPQRYVLARFTDERAHGDVKGAFRDGSRGAPAMILLKYGKGWWLWSGTYTAFHVSLRGDEFARAIMNVLRFVSGGELAPRWDMTTLDEDDILTTPRPPKLRTRKRVGRGDVAEPPEEYEICDDDVDQAGEFDLTGTLGQASVAEVVSSYWNDKWYRAVRFEGDQVQIVRVENGRQTEVALAALPAADGSAREVHVRRRHGQVLVRVDGTPVLAALDGREQKGVVACVGLEHAVCQPAKPTEFADEFMRTPKEKSPWEPVTGEWHVQQEKGDRGKGAVAQSVNPFRYEAKAQEQQQARSVVGRWSWDDYHVEVAVRPKCEQVGLLAHYESPDRYIAMRVSVVEGAGKQSAVTVVARQGQAERTIAKGKAVCVRDQWNKLGLRVSGGYVQALVDDAVVATGTDETRGTGQAGLMIQEGGAVFDDVVVKPWVAMPRSIGGANPGQWLVEQGSCEVADDLRDTLLLQGKYGTRLLSPWAGGYAYECWSRIKVAKGTQAGMYFRYVGPREHYIISLAGDAAQGGSMMRVSLNRKAKGRETEVASALTEGSINTDHLLSARVADEHIQVWVDGKMLFDVMDEGPRWGRIGLLAPRGTQIAFSGMGALPVSCEHRLMDEMTPTFAGIIDRQSWAGKQTSLMADPDDLDLLWHRGEFISDVSVKVGVRQTKGTPACAASFYLGDGEAPDSGYEMQIARAWDARAMQLVIRRLGQQVAQADYEMLITRSGFEAEMVRMNGTLALRIDGTSVLTYQDAQALDVRRVGVKLTGAKLNPSDTRVETPNARVYTFGTAATDWITECGTWEVASRWSCQPGWTWFAGWDAADAWTTNKHVFVGDQRMDAFFGAKMLDLPGRGRQEVLRDIAMGLCTTPGDTKSGYRFIMGGEGNRKTSILRNGTVVAQMKWAVPQNGLHNSWTFVSAVKRGNVVSLEWEGHELLKYEDPEPIASGHVAMGTHANGVLVPKVTIYGRLQEPADGLSRFIAAASPVAMSEEGQGE